MKILLAEDDPNISTIALMALQTIGGHDVDLADNGLKALQMALSDHSYDVILLDEMMPEMNGLRVCEEYQKQSTHPKPVIFLSAKSQDSDVCAFHAKGLGFIPKPFDPIQLAEQIIDILKLSGVSVA